MGDGLQKTEIIPDYFQASQPDTDSHQQGDSSPSTSADSRQHRSPSASLPSTDNSSSFLSLLHFSRGCSLWTQKKLRSASFMLRLFSLRGLPFTGSDGEEKVELTAVELQSLRAELADLEEREAQLKARLENLDEILQWARLSGYLYIRTRWAALPGEPPPVDDLEVDDWLPRFIVLQGPCIFLYQSSMDLSPQDSTLLTDIVEVGSLPDLVRENEEIRYCFYILTRYGLRYECASISKIQVDSWLRALQTDCKLAPDKTAMDEQLNCTYQNTK